MAKLNTEINNMVVKETMTTARDSFLKLKPSDPRDIHEVLIAIHQNNLDQLHDTLMDRGTPGHPLYQQWLSFEQIGEMIRNDEALTSVESWLKSESIEVTWRSPRGEYIKARTRIEERERVLGTRFYEWQDSTDKGNSVHHRSESYSVPSSLSEHISAIFNTCQVPPVIKRHYAFVNITRSKVPQRYVKTCQLSNQCEVSVPFINSLYGISSNAGSTVLSQAVFETAGEGYLPSDLAAFQAAYGLPNQAALNVGMTPPTSCSTSTCPEGSLDIQYLSGLAQQTPSYFWYTDTPNTDVFFNFLVQVASSSKPPTSLSISWGSYEDNYPRSFLDAFNTEAMKVTAMGVTIFAASGDDGVAGYNCQCTADSSSKYSLWGGDNAWTGNGYFAQYPASCPYVVTVGATQGPENGLSEMASQVNNHFLN